MVKINPKTTIEKFIKAIEICRDLVTFISTCGEIEFSEKIATLQKLKLDWQCSQDTHEPDLTSRKIKNYAVPVSSNEALAQFKNDNK